MARKTQRLPLPPERGEPKRGVVQGPKRAVKPWEKVPAAKVPEAKAKTPPPKPSPVPEELPDLAEDAMEGEDGAGFDLESALMGGEERNDFEKVFALMLKKENIRHVTDVNSDEITAFSALGALSKRYNLTALKAFLLENAEWRVSKNRKGRNEIVKITQRTMNPEGPPQSRRFFDFRR